MAGIIKKQILKHLSKFAKNVSPDSVNVSTLKGEGELMNLDLNEEVLTDLLELPLWMRISKATVNRVKLKVQWTKLKSVPIVLTLDEVRLEIHSCSTLRPQNKTQLPAYSSGGGYGFYDKVIDGVTVNVNSVVVTFRSLAFHASFQLSRIVLESKSPNWQTCDLRMTRLRDPDRGEVLIFKELSWQTLRIEASSCNDTELAPLRLITNQARCRITIKKKLTDCSILGCRLLLLMDDLLWVLTDAQLTAAFRFIDSLSDLVKQSTQLGQKVKAARKLESLPEFQALQSQQARSPAGSRPTHTAAVPQQSNMGRIFSKYDVVETSYHFYSQHIDLHFCDDMGAGRSTHPDLTAGAAMQVTLTQLQVDYYPYHLAAGDRNFWVRYSPECSPFQWAQSSLAQFRTNLIDALSNKTSHTPLSRAPPHNQGQAPTPSTAAAGNSPIINLPPPSHSPIRSTVTQQMRKLMSSCCVVRLADAKVYRAATPRQKQVPREFIAGDKGRFMLEDMSLLHLEYTLYYYPGDGDLPVPPQSLYVQMSPMQVALDMLSILWLNAFTRNMQMALTGEEVPMSYLDIYLEAMLPRVVLESSEEYPHQKDRPKSMQCVTSRLVVSNVRPVDPTCPGSLASLAACLEAAQQGELFFATNFPAGDEDMQPILEKFLHHAMGEDNVRQPPMVPNDSIYEAFRCLSTESMWVQARDVFFVQCEPVWVEFMDVPTARNRPVPFVDAFPLSLWLYTQPGENKEKGSVGNLAESCAAKVTGKGGKKYSDGGEKDVYMLAHTPSLVNMQINHYQYLFLMREMDVLSELSIYMSYDTCRIVGGDMSDLYAKQGGLVGGQSGGSGSKETGSKRYSGGSMTNHLGRTVREPFLVFASIFPQVDLSLIMPPPCAGKDLGGEEESLVPDSSSVDLQDIPSPSGELPNSVSNHSLNNEAEDFPVDASKETVEISQYPVHGMGKILPVSVSVTDFGTELPTVPEYYGNGGVTMSQSSGNFQLPSDLSRKLAGRNGPSSSFLNNAGGFLSVYREIASGFGSMVSSAVEVSSGVININSPDDMSDTISVRSDVSSDSDNFILINMGESDRVDGLGGALGEALFHVEGHRNEIGHPPAPPTGGVEFASEVFEEATPSEVSTATFLKRKDSVAVVTFRLSRLQIVQESHGFESTLKVQACSISCEECSGIAYDEFQNKFTSHCRGWSDSLAATMLPSSLKLRLENRLTDMGSCPPNSVSMSGSHSLEPSTTLDTKRLPFALSPFLEVRVCDLNLGMGMNTTMGLVDLMEDEVVAQPIEMKIILENTWLRLTEDRPSASISSPGPVTSQFWVPSMSISRDLDGVFTFLPQENAPNVVAEKEDHQLIERLRTTERQMQGERRVLEEEKKRVEEEQRKVEVERLQLDAERQKLANDRLKLNEAVRFVEAVQRKLEEKESRLVEFEAGSRGRQQGRMEDEDEDGDFTLVEKH